MKNFFLLITIFFLSATSPLMSQNNATSEALGKDDKAFKWGNMAITATANNADKVRPIPTVTSRFLELTFVVV